MKKSIILIAIVVMLGMTSLVFAVDQVSCTVKRNDGVVLGATLTLEYYDQNYGWLELDYSRNYEITGYYSLEFGTKTSGYRVVCELDLGHTLYSYFENPGNHTINFVYVPGDDD